MKVPKSPVARIVIRVVDLAISLVAVPVLMLLALGALGVPVAVTVKTVVAVAFLKAWFLYGTRPKAAPQQPIVMMLDPRSPGQQ